MLNDQNKDGQSDLDIDAFSVQGNKESDEQDQAALDIDSINLQGDSEAPQPKSPPILSSQAAATSNPTPQPSAVPAETFYQVRSLGHILGPLNWDTLAEMVTSGSLSQGDEIQVSDGDWLNVENIPGLLELGLQVDSAVAEPVAPATASKSKAVSAKQSLAGSTPGRKKRKSKKKKPKEDALLKEIFAEVFTADGTLRDRDSAKPPAPSPDTPVAATASSSPAMPATTAAAPPVAPQQPAYTSPPQSFKPPPKPMKKKSSGTGGGIIEMPDGKTLGIVGGIVLAAGLAIAYSMGAISVPGTQEDPRPFFTEVASAFTVAHAGSPEDWKKFCGAYASPALKMQQSLGTNGGGNAERYSEAASALIKLTTYPFKAKQEQLQTFKELNDALLGTSAK